MFIFEKIMGSDEVEISNVDDCTEINLENETGSGKMSLYKFFDAVYVSFNDFHLEKCESRFDSSENILCIDHCREGRIEWDNGNGSFTYIESGDMMISNRQIGSNERIFSFPISHYHGVTILFDINKAKKLLPKLMGGFSADIQRINHRYCGDGGTFMMRADRQIEHIFSELYNLPKKIRVDYCKIKTLELLLFLDSAEFPAEHSLRQYYGRANVEKVKGMARLMTSNLQKRYTNEELSKMFDFPLTSMKKCFKAVFGQSVYAYMRSYRMNCAMVMLKNGKQSILEIAGFVGYDNAGKFSSAFRDVVGCTPSQYRKNVTEWISEDKKEWKHLEN